jgi:hypothetical protein
MRGSLRYTGVAAVATSWTTLLTAAARTRFNVLGDRPLSYMGTQPRSVVLFGVGLAMPAVLLTAFHGYVRGRFPVGKGFSAAMLAGLAGQMVAAFVPIGGNLTASRIHTTCALGLGASLPLLMWRFSAGQRPGSWRRLAYGLFWAEAAACVLGLSGALPAPVAEIIPGAVFHLWIFTVTFAGAAAVSPAVSSTPGAATAPLCPAAAGLVHGRR